jgi:hypothetical protein
MNTNYDETDNKIPSVNFDIHNICLINMRDIIALCESDIFDDLHQYHLLDKFSFKCRDTKKVLYHHLLSTICDVYIHHFTFNRIVVYYNETECMKTSLGRLGNRYRAGSFLNTTINKIKSLLPIRILYNDSIEFDKVASLINSSTGEGKDFLLKIKLLFAKNNSNFNFLKVKNFARRYDLTFLSEKIFNSFFVKYKMLVQ